MIGSFLRQNAYDLGAGPIPQCESRGSAAGQDYPLDCPLSGPTDQQSAAAIPYEL